MTSADPSAPARAPALHEAPARARTLLFALAIGAIYALVLYDKPLQVDDPHYVYGARHLLKAPLDPLGNLINWRKSPVPAWQDLINPPLYSYLQAGWMALFGPSIRGLHLLTALMASLTAVGCVGVARRFTARPFLAASLALLGPGVLPVANVMVDLPALAIGSCAVALFLSGVDEGRRGRLLLGGIATGLALLTKYNAVVLLPVLALHAWRRGRPRALLTLAIPVAMLLAWSVWSWLLHGRVHFLTAAEHSTYARTIATYLWNLYSAAILPGCGLVFFGALLLPRRRLAGVAFWGPICALMLVGPLDLIDSRDAAPPLFYWLFALNSVTLLAFAASAPRSGVDEPRPLARRDTTLLWTWIGCVALFQVALAYHQSPRYYTLAYLPLAILLVRALDGAGTGFERGKSVLGWSSVAVTLAVALAVAAADDAHARANQVYPGLVAGAPGVDPERVFCLGHWGFQFYCEERGFSTFDAIDGTVRAGDLFLVPQNNDLSNLPSAFVPLPQGRLLCDGRPLLELLRLTRFVPARPAGGSDWPVTRWLGELHRAVPLGVTQRPHAFYYAALFPRLPYTLSPRGAVDERFLMLRAVCDHDLSRRAMLLEFDSAADELFLVDGFALSLQEQAGVARSSAAASVIEVVLDAEPGDYLLRLQGRSEFPDGGPPVDVAVQVNGRPVTSIRLGEVERTYELPIDAAALRRLNRIVFEYSRLRELPGAAPRAAVWSRIELVPAPGIETDPSASSGRSTGIAPIEPE